MRDAARLRRRLPADALNSIDVVDGSQEELIARIRALLADSATLAKLPELHRLRTALDSLGLGELLADVTARRLAPQAALAAFEHAWLRSVIDHVR